MLRNSLIPSGAAAVSAGVGKRARMAAVSLLVAAGALLGLAAADTRTALAQGGPAAAVLIDGSYQPVRQWEIKGDRVRFVSTERNGVWEELPVSLVDWAATEKFAHGHTEAGREESAASADARAVDAEAAAEKAETRQCRSSVLKPANMKPVKTKIKSPCTPLAPI